MNDYLWDKSGEPDPEIQRLEDLLSSVKYRGSRISFPRKRWVPFAVAASLILATAGAWMALHRESAGWQVSALAGNPGVTRLAKGQFLQTDANSRAKLELADVGEVEVEPNTRIGVVAIRPDEQRLELKHGKIHASIWAPPGRFSVNTPSALTVDLGCAYTLEVSEDGVGLVRVTAGWVAFESNGTESFIPATAICKTRPGRGPGIPFYEDAPESLRVAVERFDVGGILASATPRDAMTIWHLLRRVPADRRGEVYDALAQRMSIPPGVSRNLVIEGDANSIDRLWDALDLGNTSSWRLWKSRTPYLPK